MKERDYDILFFYQISDLNTSSRAVVVRGKKSSYFIKTTHIKNKVKNTFSSLHFHAILTLVPKFFLPLLVPI